MECKREFFTVFNVSNTNLAEVRKVAFCLFSMVQSQHRNLEPMGPELFVYQEVKIMPQQPCVVIAEHNTARSVCSADPAKSDIQATL